MSVAFWKLLSAALLVAAFLSAFSHWLVLGVSLAVCAVASLALADGRERLLRSREDAPQ